jgi:hypothetical protein
MAGLAFSPPCRSLARRIIAGAAEFAVAPRPLDIQQQRVAAGNDQRHMRRHLVRSRNGDKQMPFQMVDAEKWPPKAQAMPLAAVLPINSEEASPGPLVAANASISAIVTPASASAFFDKSAQPQRMVAGGKLGHHPAVFAVQFDLR